MKINNFTGFSKSFGKFSNEYLKNKCHINPINMGLKNTKPQSLIGIIPAKSKISLLKADTFSFNGKPREIEEPNYVVTYAQQARDPKFEWKEFDWFIQRNKALRENPNINYFYRDLEYEILRKGQGELKNYALREIIENGNGLLQCEPFMKYVGDFLHCIQSPSSLVFADKIMNEDKFYNSENNMKHAAGLLWHIKDDTEDILKLKLTLFNKLFDKTKSDKYAKKAGSIMYNLNHASAEKIKFTLDLVSDESVSVDSIPFMINFYHKVDEDELKETMGDKKLSCADKQIASRFLNFYQINNIDEIPIGLRRNFLDSLLTFNASLFNLSPVIRKSFPLLPKNQEEYCSTLQNVVSSLDIKTNSLNQEERSQFFKDLNNLAKNLSEITDEEFNNLSITQEYSQADFIKDILNKTKNLTDVQRQHVCSNFGFEFYKNNSTPTGYSLSGCPYPNDEDLSPEAELIKDEVNKFAVNNQIHCNDKSLEPLLNDILKALPELRTTILRKQNGEHQFDVFKHSLKVLQKIAVSADSLPEEDKKVMFLAALLHDISKKEGLKDKTHDYCSALDVSFIAKKLNLTEDEAYKLYTLIANHHFLEKIDSAEAKETAMKQIAYNLRYSNMLDMAKIFCAADMMALKKDNGFYNEKKEFLNSTTETLKKYKNYLKETQPVLPCEKLPKASTIQNNIKVNHDGSTNIKGVYVNKQGLVILKFNEIEDDDWSKIGLPKGVNSDRIRFFAHALINESQLANFAKFSLPLSQEIIYTSYVVNPKEKYKFFWPQGIALTCKTQDIHGVLCYDSGSRTKISIPEYSKECFLNGNMQKFRSRFKDYMEGSPFDLSKFYNKSFSQIAQENEADAIIIANALNYLEPYEKLNGKTYNEVLISNPDSPMAVWAYDEEGKKIDNPVKYLEQSNNTKFLQDYALKSDIPFILFGD